MYIWCWVWEILVGVLKIGKSFFYLIGENVVWGFLVNCIVLLYFEIRFELWIFLSVENVFLCGFLFVLCENVIVYCLGLRLFLVGSGFELLLLGFKMFCLFFILEVLGFGKFFWKVNLFFLFSVMVMEIKIM